MAILSDLRYAIRMLGRSPVFTLTSVASLAIGIAAATTIFSLTDALLFEPAPGVRDAAAVVDIGRANKGEGGFDNMSYPAVKYLTDHTQSLEGMAAVQFGGRPMTLNEANSSERIFGVLVSGNYFDVLGTKPALGRFFRLDEDEVPGERPVVLVTQRTRETAIRMALGASAGKMQSMVMRQAAWLGATGGVIGLLLAGVIGTLAQSLLVGVPAIDPISFGATAVLFAIVLTAACWSPARRAASTDPATALRAE